MPWTMDDYPSSLKNFDKAIRKKAIEMANSMVKDGYSESRAIPIATEQAKKWKENADDNEIAHFLKHGKVTPSNRLHQKQPTSLNMLSSAKMDGLFMRKEQSALPMWQIQKKKRCKEHAKLQKTKEQALKSTIKCLNHP